MIRRAAARVSSELQAAAPALSEALSAPEPLGPCQLQASPFCEGTASMERLDPMAMAPEDPAPASVIPTCPTCFGARSDVFLAVSAR